jgi:hypothetical protein
MLDVTVTLSSALRRNTSVAGAAQARKVGRTAMGKFVAGHIRDRVQRKGLGAGNSSLAGYSTNPVNVSRGLLPKKKPADGLPKFYKGGYVEYRKDVGLQVSHFAFTNTGNSFRGFMADVGDAAVSTPVKIGFIDPKSHQAAVAAVERGRPDMFGLDANELDSAMQVYLDSVVDSVWKDFFDSVSTNNAVKETT